MIWVRIRGVMGVHTQAVIVIMALDEGATGSQMLLCMAAPENEAPPMLLSAPHNGGDCMGGGMRCPPQLNSCCKQSLIYIIVKLTLHYSDAYYTTVMHTLLLTLMLRSMPSKYSRGPSISERTRFASCLLPSSNSATAKTIIHPAIAFLTN